MVQTLVKCPDCEYVFKTSSDDETQCSVSNGCGIRFNVDENEVAV